MGQSIGQNSSSNYELSGDLSQSFSEVKKGFETITGKEQAAASLFESPGESFATSQNTDKKAIEATLSSRSAQATESQQSPLASSFEDRPLTQEELRQQSLFRQVCAGNNMLQELHFLETHPEFEEFLSGPMGAQG